MSIFGQAAAGGSSLFGQPAQNQNQSQPGQAAPATGGIFGTMGQNKPAAAGSSLFGSTATPAATTGGLFGQPNQNQQTAAPATGGGLFGAAAAPAKPSLFGASTTTPAAATGSSLFGAAAAQQPQQQVQQPAMGGLGASVMNQPSASLARSSAGPAGPAGAYFDSLFAKSQKTTNGKTNMEDLPSLELGLGDLRHRLRKLQSKPGEKTLDGKAHYVLQGSGVDLNSAAKDLGMLDVQGGRTERAPHAGAVPVDVDVESYLSNLQTKTTLSMITDGLERSLRDFDNFLEDSVAMEWDAQRKRIYSHFGIKPREGGLAHGRESQAGFGRSRRSKGPGAAAGRSTNAASMANSQFHRSVIGAPARIGTHQTEFSDIERASEKKRGVTEDRASRERQAKLAEKIRHLNVARLNRVAYPILGELCEIEQKSHEPHAPHVVEAYRAVIEIVGEDANPDPALGYASSKERQFAQMYLDENPNSTHAVEMRKRILSGANTFLENQFLREVESLIAKHPHEAKLGGLPDITSKIKAYIRLRSARKDLVPDNTELQQIQGEYVWAIVFYLLRSGHVNEAAKYVNDNSNHFRGIDRTFSTYLNNYAASEDRRITNRKLLDRCTNEYIQRYRNAPDNTIDPFRMACYKIIGRIELANRNLEGLKTDINDWTWLQFNLAREGDKTVEMAGESFGLAELQASVREIGQKHFPKAGSEDSNGAFGLYFYLQVLAGMFEDAISYLYSFSYIDAVHFALALEFYGLLRPSDPMSAANELRSLSIKGLPQINFGRMIGYYTRDFRAADVISAVDYLTLICLNQDLGGEAGRRQSGLCHEALRELVLETREFSKLIGDIRPDGQHLPGIIENRGPLIGFDEEDDFIKTVTLQAASFADENGRTTDSVLLYHLAGEYDAVIAIVSRALSEAISLEIGEDPMRLAPIKPRAGGKEAEGQQGTSLSLAAIDDPVELAKTMMSMYERDAMFYRKIQDQNKVACRVLLEMSSIKSLVEAGQWAQCLDVSSANTLLGSNNLLTKLAENPRPRDSSPGCWRRCQHDPSLRRQVLWPAPTRID